MGGAEVWNRKFIMITAGMGDAGSERWQHNVQGRWRSSEGRCGEGKRGKDGGVRGCMSALASPESGVRGVSKFYWYWKFNLLPN